LKRKPDKSFGGWNLLSAVSFAISSGEKVGIVDPNGAGMIAPLKMIAGDEPTSAGKVNLWGVEKSRVALENSWRSRTTCCCWTSRPTTLTRRREKS